MDILILVLKYRRIFPGLILSPQISTKTAPLNFHLTETQAQAETQTQTHTDRDRQRHSQAGRSSSHVRVLKTANSARCCTHKRAEKVIGLSNAQPDLFTVSALPAETESEAESKGGREGGREGERARERESSIDVVKRSNPYGRSERTLCNLWVQTPAQVVAVRTGRCAAELPPEHQVPSHRRGEGEDAESDTETHHRYHP